MKLEFIAVALLVAALAGMGFGGLSGQTATAPWLFFGSFVVVIAGSAGFLGFSLGAWRARKNREARLLVRVCETLVYGTALTGIALSAAGTELILAGAAAALLAFLTIAAGAAWFGFCRRAMIPWRRSVVTAFTAVTLLISTAWTQWPLRASVALARPRLDALAARIAAGENIDSPCYVGLIRIKKGVHRPDGIVCLWTLPRAGGDAGLVQCSRERARSGTFSNLNYVVTMHEDWQFIGED